MNIAMHIKKIKICLFALIISFLVTMVFISHSLDTYDHKIEPINSPNVGMDQSSLFVERDLSDMSSFETAMTNTSQSTSKSISNYILKNTKGVNATNLSLYFEPPLKRTTLSVNDIEQVRKDNNARKNSVHRACQNNANFYIVKNRTKLLDFIHNRLYVDEKHKMIFCPVQKVGCTNWVRIMVIMGGRISRKKAWTRDVWTYLKHYVRKLTNYRPEDRDRILKEYFKVMFVREPLERLLSAYKDKLANTEEWNRAWFRTYGSRIIRIFRPNATVEEIQRGNDTTFKEFANYVIRFPPVDSHWLQYHKLCAPCFIEYDFIGKYETMDRDAEFVLRHLNVDKSIQFPKKYKARLGSKHVYFKNLSEKDIRELWNVYQADYVMFDYKYPNFTSIS